jgi:hypothetical protein
VWWLWIVGGLTIWLVVGLLFAVVVGRGIRLADERSPDTGVDPVPAVPARVATGTRRGAVPLPAAGVALVAVALGLETCGFVLRLMQVDGPLARILSMDAPFSVPRMFVAATFAAAAVAAVAGAGLQQGRRTWWFAVALVTAGVATVKAGGTVHASAMHALADTVGSTSAVLLSVLLASAVLGGLLFLSRHERRDRRRVLGALSGYAVAAVGLSAVTTVVSGSFATTWVTAAAFVEESGEALGGVAVLLAVLVGVAPQLVLPRDWALRRRADAELAEGLRPPLSQRGARGA